MRDDWYETDNDRSETDPDCADRIRFEDDGMGWVTLLVGLFGGLGLHCRRIGDHYAR